MLRNTKIISVQLTQEQADAIDARAQEAPFFGNRSECLRQLVTQALATPAASPSSPQSVFTQHDLLAVHDEYCEQISQLDDQVRSLSQEVAQLGQDLLQAQSAHQQRQQQLGEKLMDEKLLLARLEFVHKDTLRQLDFSQQQVADLKATIEQLTTQRDEYKQKREEYKQQLARFKSAEGLSQLVTGAIGKGIDSSPSLKQNFEEGGLLGLFRGRPSPNLDQILRLDFPQAALAPVKNALRFYRDRPAELTRLLGSEPYKAYLAGNSSPGSGTARQSGGESPSSKPS